MPVDEMVKFDVDSLAVLTGQQTFVQMKSRQVSVIVIKLVCITGTKDNTSSLC